MDDDLLVSCWGSGDARRFQRIYRPRMVSRHRTKAMAGSHLGFCQGIGHPRLMELVGAVDWMVQLQGNARRDPVQHRRGIDALGRVVYDNGQMGHLGQREKVNIMFYSFPLRNRIWYNLDATNLSYGVQKL